MSGQYLITDQGVFYTFRERVPAGSADTFRQVGDRGPVAVDQNYAFWGTYRFEADPATLDCVLPGLLYKDAGAVYAYGGKLGRADPASFRLLSHPHPCLALAADRQQRFIFESLTGGFMSQPDSLGKNAAKLKKVLSITRVPTDGDERLWIDQATRNFAPKAMSSEDSEETAMVVSNDECWLETRQHVPCDPSSFEAITEYTGRDENHFFQCTAIIPEVDKDSVEHIDDTFFKDKNHVFCLWGPYTPVPKADPKSFHFIEPPTYPARYAVDEKAGYCLMYGAQRIKVKRFTLPNPGALRIVKRTYATDGITTFKDGVPVKVAPET